MWGNGADARVARKKLQKNNGIATATKKSCGVAELVRGRASEKKNKRKDPSWRKSSPVHLSGCEQAHSGLIVHAPSLMANVCFGSEAAIAVQKKNSPPTSTLAIPTPAIAMLAQRLRGRMMNMDNASMNKPRSTLFAPDQALTRW